MTKSLNKKPHTKAVLHLIYILLIPLYIGTLLSLSRDFLNENFPSVILTTIIIILVVFLIILVNRNNLLRRLYDEEKRKLEVTQKDYDVSSRLLIRRDIELTRSNEKLQKLDQAKSEFVSVAAHQLRTPLTGIKWTLDLFLNGEFGKINEEQKAFLFKAQESNNHMIHIINDMLGADRIETGKYKYNLHNVQVEGLVDSLLFELYSKVIKNKLTVNVKRDSNLLPRVKVDVEKMHEVFQNLIDNAIKYTKVGGTIDIDYRVEDKFVVVSIKDSGIGIPKAEQQKMFNKFFRASNAQKMQTDGSGLGLVIVKGIIEAHGGKIWFESEENQGTTFYISVPIASGQN